MPLVAVGIRHHPRSVAVEFVLDGTKERRARGEGLRNGLVHVLYVKVQRHRRAAQSDGAQGAEVRVLVGQHESRAADLELRVADLSFGIGQTKELFGAERFVVEADRLWSALDDQVGRERLGVVRYGFDGHGETLSSSL